MKSFKLSDRHGTEIKMILIYLKMRLVSKKNSNMPSKIILYVINLALLHSDVCGSGGIAPSFLTFASNEGECSGSRPGRFTPEECALIVDLIGD
jgi:hypothetical protein